MTKNKKILALSFGLIVLFSNENAHGMKRKMNTVADEEQDAHSSLQKQIGLESFYNNTEFSEQGTIHRIDQAISSHSNKDNNVDDAYTALLVKVENLIVDQADLNEQDSDGNTFLHRAVLSGYEDIVQLLIGNGVDCSITNNNGNTPFDLAINEGHHEIARFLMDNE